MQKKGSQSGHVQEAATGHSRKDASSTYPGGAGVLGDHRRLTRAAFTKTLQQQTERKSVFNVKGLHRLQPTFHALDRSIGSGLPHYDDEEGAEPVVCHEKEVLLHVYGFNRASMC